MDAGVAFCAQTLPLLIPVAATVLWLALPRPDKWRLALHTIVGLGLTAALVLLVGSLHNDPRPFVVDPSQPALFPHPPDNGFPSDHTAYAGAIALLVMLVRRRLGTALLVLSLVGGLAPFSAP